MTLERPMATGAVVDDDLVDDAVLYGDLQRDRDVVLGLGLGGDVQLLHPGADAAGHLHERVAEAVHARVRYPLELSHAFNDSHFARGDARNAAALAGLRAHSLAWDLLVLHLVCQCVRGLST